MVEYYTPDPSDVFVGYECEWYLQPEETEIWEFTSRKEYQDFMLSSANENFKKVVMNKKDVAYILQVVRPVRTLYLTKEQIEEAGFEEYAKSIDSWFKFKESPVTHTKIQEQYGYKPYTLYLNYGFHDQRLKIKCDFSGGEDWDGSDILFDGKCPSINEFRKICKLLGI